MPADLPPRVSQGFIGFVPCGDAHFKPPSNLAQALVVTSRTALRLGEEPWLPGDPSVRIARRGGGYAVLTDGRPDGWQTTLASVTVVPAGAQCSVERRVQWFKKNECVVAVSYASLGHGDCQSVVECARATLQDLERPRTGGCSDGSDDLFDLSEKSVRRAGILHCEPGCIADWMGKLEDPSQFYGLGADAQVDAARDEESDRDAQP